MQISSQISGFAQATSSGYKTLAAIPGKTIIHRGKSFKNDAIMQPPLAWIIVLAANVLWTITWSEHQYQIEETESPNTKKIHFIITSPKNKSKSYPSLIFMKWVDYLYRAKEIFLDQLQLNIRLGRLYNLYFIERASKKNKY